MSELVMRENKPFLICFATRRKEKKPKDSIWNELIN